jgi:hypothetical protein
MPIEHAIRTVKKLTVGSTDQVQGLADILDLAQFSYVRAAIRWALSPRGVLWAMKALRALASTVFQNLVLLKSPSI